MERNDQKWADETEPAEREADGRKRKRNCKKSQCFCCNCFKSVTSIGAGKAGNQKKSGRSDETASGNSRGTGTQCQDGYQNCGNSGARSVQFLFFRVHFGNRRICQGSGTDHHYLPYEGVRPGRSEVSSDVKGNACMRDHYDSHIR